MRVVVSTTARLHLGQLDLNGSLGRLYGGIGVAIEKPLLEVEAESSPDLVASGEQAGKAELLARRFLAFYGLGGGARLRVLGALPEHVGLGSGTQLALSIATALARLHGVDAPPSELAAAVNRGESRSGIGLGAFEGGGFILDGGLQCEAGRRAGIPPEAPVRAGASGSPPVPVPPILFRHPFPEDWSFVVAIPQLPGGLSGQKESNAFSGLPPMPDEVSGRVCRLVIMQLLPALLEKDIRSFGRALTEIQVSVGTHFAPAQGGVFSSPLSEELVDLFLNHGACGAGQSSWGPAVYGLAPDVSTANRLASTVRAFLNGRCEAQVLVTRARNCGAMVRVNPQEGEKSFRDHQVTAAI